LRKLIKKLSKTLTKTLTKTLKNGHFLRVFGKNSQKKGKTLQKTLKNSTRQERFSCRVFFVPNFASAKDNCAECLDAEKEI